MCVSLLDVYHKGKKYHQEVDGTIKCCDYYRLTKSFRDTQGVSRKRSVLCLGTLKQFTDAERDELADMRTSMIESGQGVMSENRDLYEKAMELYLKYRVSRYAGENDHILKAEAERKMRERRHDMVTVKFSSLTRHEARTIGAEILCNSTLRLLKIREFLNAKGWSRETVDLALMQLIARATYPFFGVEEPRKCALERDPKNCHETGYGNCRSTDSEWRSHQYMPEHGG